MKQFFESYGGVALGILALLVLIAMITPVGNIIKTSLQGTAHKFSTSINSQTDDAFDAMQKIQESATDLLSIGSIIRINDLDMNHDGIDDTFRLFSYDGDVAKVLSMEAYNKVTMNSFDVTTFSNGVDGFKYAGSKIDTEAIEYYNNLPQVIKNAIIAENLTQAKFKNVYAPEDENAVFTSFHKDSFASNIKETDAGVTKYSAVLEGAAPVGSRCVYVPGVQDLVQYLGNKSTPQAINTAIYGVDHFVSDRIWLRDAGGTGFAYNQFGLNSHIDDDLISAIPDTSLRVMFSVKVNEIDWELVG